MNDDRGCLCLRFLLREPPLILQPLLIKTPKMGHGIPTLINDAAPLFKEMVQNILITVGQLFGIFPGKVKPPCPDVQLAPVGEIQHHDAGIEVGGIRREPETGSLHVKVAITCGSQKIAV
jgi:hypothetical protein